MVYDPTKPFPNLGNPNIQDNNSPNVNPSLNTGVSAASLANIVNPLNITVPGQYNNTKGSLGSVLPEHAVSTHPYARMEPLITPEQVRTRFLFGIPLFSNQKDPRTGRRSEITDEMIARDFIPRAVMQSETSCHIDIFPVQRAEKHPFDKALYEAFGYFLTEHKPILSLEKLSVTPSNNIDVYVVPLQWIEAAGFPRGQVNIVPLTAAFQGSGFLPPSQSAGGAAFLQILGSKNWIPYYWQLLYTSGFPNGTVPILINELIGNFSAKLILELLAASNKIPNYSLAIDGVSQSVNTSGPNVYDVRLQQINESIASLVDRIQKLFSLTRFCHKFLRE